MTNTFKLKFHHLVLTAMIAVPSTASANEYSTKNITQANQHELVQAQKNTATIRTTLKARTTTRRVVESLPTSRPSGLSYTHSSFKVAHVGNTAQRVTLKSNKFVVTPGFNRRQSAMPVLVDQGAKHAR